MTPETKSFELGAKLPVDLAAWLEGCAKHKEEQCALFGDKSPAVVAHLRDEIPWLRAAARELRVMAKLHNELVMAVARKRKGESRHETVLRYIREAEEGTVNQNKTTT